MKICIILLFACMLSNTAQSQSLQSIIDGYQKAVGGKEKYPESASVIIKSKTQGGGGGEKRPMVFTLKSPDKARMDFIFQPGLTYVQAFDGSNGWSIQPWTGSNDPQPLNEDDSKDAKRMVKMVWNDLLLNGSDGSAIEYSGKDEIEGSEVYKITAKSPDGASRMYYLDIDSYLIIKTTVKYNESGVARESDSFYSEYKVIDGRTLPYNIESKANGETVGVSYIEAYQFDKQVDDSFFLMPSKSK